MKPQGWEDICSLCVGEREGKKDVSLNKDGITVVKKDSLFIFFLKGICVL